MTSTHSDFDVQYGRLVNRSMFQSLVWAVISERKRNGGFSLQQLADALDIDKSNVTRWFKSPPNWTLDKVYDIATALGVELDIQARERATGKVFTPTGTIHVAMSASQTVNVPHAQDTTTGVVRMTDRWDMLAEGVAA